MVDAPLGTFSRMRQHEGNEGSGRVGTAVIERRPRRGPRRLRPIDESLLAEAARTRPVGRPGGGGCATPTVELWALHLRYAREHDPADLEALVEEYQDLARSLARRMYRRGEPLDELRQVAMEALVRVLQSFEPERGVPFVGYATPSIVGRLKRHYRDQGWSIRIGRDDQQIHQASIEARAELQGLRGREPTEAEVGERLGRPVAQLRSADLAARARTTQSLDGDAADGGSLHDRLGEDDARLGLAENHVDLQRAVAHLDRRACELLYLYYWGRLSQAAIAERYGTNQMQVSRWLARAIGELRGAMSA